MAVSATLHRPGRIDTPYNEHGRSYIANQHADRGMVYPPESVAEAIIYAAVHHKKDIYIGINLTCSSERFISRVKRQVYGGVCLSHPAKFKTFEKQRA
jgi:hypothetical protein